MNGEQLKKAKEAKSALELKELAAAEGTELTDEQAEAYYAQLHKSGALSDEELDNVAGGGCNAKDGRLVVTTFHVCDYWTCKKCGSTSHCTFENGGADVHTCTNGTRVPYVNCNSCKFMTYEKGLWLCNNPANRA